MRRTFAALLLLFLGSCVSGSAPGLPLFGETGPLAGKYAGEDAGFLILTLAAQPGTPFDYAIYFRKKDRSAQSRVWWGQTNPFDMRKVDLDSKEDKGLVDVRRLPPGDYELFNFEVAWSSPSFHYTWRAREDFSIPFTIVPGRATYVGEFLGVEVKGENILGMPVPDGAYFVLMDKMERDVAIAKRKEPGVGEVTDAFVDPVTVGNPLISAHIH